ncbi:hypothetical protein EVAR_103048_1 [Eumeta japonica]|uniref:Uncharacterized protein n=1 Tax=Eumeta variegata TaxID=151549 RepID=A0A4C1WCA4_EUMVA|nr:hypothetical protein EVAR_103048_1 [Eumeta japonica]
MYVRNIEDSSDKNYGMSAEVASYRSNAAPHTSPPRHSMPRPPLRCQDTTTRRDVRRPCNEAKRTSKQSGRGDTNSTGASNVGKIRILVAKLLKDNDNINNSQDDDDDISSNSNESDHGDDDYEDASFFFVTLS